ncbi:MAG: hypothetical protein GY716_17040 [bacterium]|nr:hypothetical protein [bacterium]
MRARLVPLLLLSTLSIAPGIADERTTRPRVVRLLEAMSFDDRRRAEILNGELTTTTAPERSDSELAVTAALLLPVDFDSALRHLGRGEPLGPDRGSTAYFEFGETPARPADFDGLEVMRGHPAELRRLFAATPGSGLHLDSDTLTALASIRSRFEGEKCDDNRACGAAVADQYRRTLVRYVSSYRKGGLSALAPYVKESGRTVSPGKILQQAGRELREVAAEYPELVREFVEYPQAGKRHDHLLFWTERTVQGRPTPSLGHRITRIDDGVAIVLERYFYVGHSYHTLQAVIGVLAIDRKKTVVFFHTRADSEAVAKFPVALRRSLGRRHLMGELRADLNAVARRIRP